MEAVSPTHFSCITFASLASLTLLLAHHLSVAFYSGLQLSPNFWVFPQKSFWSTGA